MFSFLCICMTIYQYDNICDLFCYIISSALYLSFECHQTICFAGDDADAHDEMIEEEQQEHDPEVEVKEVD